MSLKKKVVWLPYDFDSAIGINNDGELVFDYQLEDIDYQRSGAPIFNGQDSVIWKNIRAAFADELKTMYQNLRSSGALSYDKIEQMFEEHQSKWSEAVFNEDSQFKYIVPFVRDNANYLYMLLGSKEEQRKWWLYNRFRYIDSKYIAGDARSDSIFLRPYAASDITLIPYADIYATIAWDATITQSRATRNQSVTLTCPYQTMNGNIVTIYSSSQLASIGDLSPLQIGQIDISNATRLQSLKVGSSATGYDNSNLYSMTFGSNVLLKTVDARNCSGLGDTSLQGHTQTTVDLSGCEIIENVYFDGTKIAGVTFPNGGVLKVLHLPDTITSLIIRNQSKITDFKVTNDDYSNISTLRIENCSTAIPVLDILSEIPANSRVRLIGFYWECADATVIEEILNQLDKMRGLDEQGNNMEKAQVSGIIHTDKLTEGQIYSYKQRYPYINVIADQVVSLTYQYLTREITNYESPNNTTIGKYGLAYAPNLISVKAPFVNIDDYAFSNDSSLNVVDLSSNTSENIYLPELRFRGSSNLTHLIIRNGIKITGASNALSGSKIAIGEGSVYVPTNLIVEYKADSIWGRFNIADINDYPLTDFSTITDSWNTIINNSNYAIDYSIGDTKIVDIGSFGKHYFELVAMNEDNKADGNGKARMTWISKNLLTTHKMNSTNTTSGGYDASEMKLWITDDVLPELQSDIRNAIVPVTKISSTYESAVVKNGQTTTESLWIPSIYEMSGTTTYENTGAKYTDNFTDNTSRVKYDLTSCSATYWWTRSSDSSSRFRYISTNGSNSGIASNVYGVVLGFCI